MNRLLTSFATLVAAFLCFCSLEARAWTRVDTMLTMSDGVRLAVTYFAPSREVPREGHPAIILMHGFDVQGTAKGVFTEDAYTAVEHADSGYFALAYSVRGMGVEEHRSEGTFGWFTGDREMEDLREVIAWLGARGDVNEGRIAIEGLSQGGLMAWGAAIRGMNVRCIVPMASVPNLTRSFLADNGYSYLGQTFITAATTFDNIFIRLGPFMRDTLLRAFREDRYEDARRLIAERDVAGREGEVAVPVFMQCAWHDDIFSSGQALRSFQALRSPKKILMWSGSHGWYPGHIAGLRDRLTYRFYRRWLRDDEAETIMDADSALVLQDAATFAVRYVREDDSAAYLPQTAGGPGGVRFHLANGETLTPTPPSAPVVEARLYRMNVSDDSVVFRSAPFANREAFIAGDASLVVNSSGRTYQANVLLWDYDPQTDVRTPLMRGCMQIRENGSSVRDRVEYRLEPQLYTMREGHQLEVWVKFGTTTANTIFGIPVKPDDEFGCALFPPQETAWDTLFSSAAEPSWIEIHPFRPRPAGVVEPRAERSAIASLEASPSVVRSGDVLTVRRAGRDAASLELVSADGRRIASWELEGEETSRAIVVPELAAGAYFLRIRSGMTTSRIVVVQ